MRVRILQAALPPSCDRTGKTAAASRPAPAHRSPRSSPPLCLAVGGHGGVSGTLARKEQQLGCRGKRHPGRSPICVWCRRQRRGQPQRPKLAVSPSGVCARCSRLPVQNRRESSREFRGARLDFSVHICVRRYPHPTSGTVQLTAEPGQAISRTDDQGEGWAAPVTCATCDTEQGAGPHTWSSRTP
jgi:hypothetical protein